MATRTSLMDFQIPRIVHEEINENRGIFVIEPLDRGFGYTFGNSLRRVLLSSLEGAAVTAVKIEGVAHEFTTLPGVREDVTDIILNLKNLICLLHGESPEVEVHIAKKGAGAVTVNYGLFINSIITFLIIAFAVFLIVRAANRLRPQEAPAAPTTKDCPYCRMAIPLGATRCPQCTSELR